MNFMSYQEHATPRRTTLWKISILLYTITSSLAPKEGLLDKQSNKWRSEFQLYDLQVTKDHTNRPLLKKVSYVSYTIFPRAPRTSSASVKYCFDFSGEAPTVPRVSMPGAKHASSSICSVCKNNVRS